MNLCITLVYLSSLVLFASAASKTTAISHNDFIVMADKVKQQKRISLLSGKVSFTPPSDFRPIPHKQLKRKLPESANRLLIILANPKQTGVIKVDYLDDLNLNSGQLTEVKRFVEGTFRASNLEWVTSDIVETNKRQWFHFEWGRDVSELSKLVAPIPVDDEEKVAISDDTPIHFHEYKTIYKGKLLSFSFEAEASVYPKLKDNFIKSMESIRIKD